MTLASAMDARNWVKRTPPSRATSMFCGLPMALHALPILAFVARASKYGAGCSLRAAHALRTMGVNRIHRVSLVTSALATADTSDTRHSMRRGVVDGDARDALSSVYMPCFSRCAHMSIQPVRRVSVGRLMAANAASLSRAPIATKAHAPTAALICERRKKCNVRACTRLARQARGRCVNRSFDCYSHSGPAEA